MIVQNILNNSNIKYKLQEYDDNINIYKIGTTKVINIVSITENGNVFKLDEDLFYYLDNQPELYAFILVDKVANQYYYLDFKMKNNWIKSSFERSCKDEIYFGKIVLNNRVTQDKITEKLSMYK